MAGDANLLPHGYSTHLELLDHVRAAVVDSDVASMRDVVLSTCQRFLVGDSDNPRLSFADMEVVDLAGLMNAQPRLAVLFAQQAMYPNRPLRRELGFELLSWAPAMSQSKAMRLAQLLLPALPEHISVEAVLWVYEHKRTESALRHHKGLWEATVRERLHRLTGRGVGKYRPLRADGQGRFELDAVAWTGLAQPDLDSFDENISRPALGLDIKRIEGDDFTIRCAEMLATAERARERFPRMAIGAVLYHPFVDRHEQVRRKLLAGEFDVVEFASDDPVVVNDALLSLLREVTPVLLETGRRRQLAREAAIQPGEQTTLFGGRAPRQGEDDHE